MPLVQSAAPRMWPDHKGAAAGLVTRYTYTALVLGPVVIGPLSTGLGEAETATPLRLALGSLIVLPFAVIALARFLRPAEIDAIG
jgi:MFS family permease